MRGHRLDWDKNNALRHAHAHNPGPAPKPHSPEWEQAQADRHAAMRWSKRVAAGPFDWDDPDTRRKCMVGGDIGRQKVLIKAGKRSITLPKLKFMD